MIDRSIEESLDLCGVEIHRHKAIGSGSLEEISHQASRDRFATSMLLVLSGITVEGCDDCDPLRRSSLEGIDHDQLLHDLLIERCSMRLDDEGITTSDALLETNEDLTIGEVIGRGGSDRNSKFLGDLVCEFRVTASSEETEPLLGT